MANKAKGEVALKHGDKTYILLFDHNALCEFEAETGKNALEVLSSDNVSMIDMRALFWAGLQEHQSEITIREAGRLLTAVGDEKLYEALNAASPEPEKAKTSGNSRSGKAKPKAAPKRK